MKFVLNGGLIIGTCDGANVSLQHCKIQYVTMCFRPLMAVD